MHKNIIKFEDHELKVDFLTLSMQNSNDEKNIQKIAIIRRYAAYCV